MAAGRYKAKLTLYAIGAVVVVCLFVVVSANVQFLLSNRASSRAAAIAGLENFARSIQRSVTAEIEGTSRTLALVADIVSASGAGTIREGGYDRLLDAIILLDAQGRPIWATQQASPGDSLAQARIVQDLRTAPGTAIIARIPEAGLFPGAGLLLGRALQDAAGQFAGAVVAPVTERRLRDLLENYDMGDGSSVTLLSDDGRLVASGNPATPSNLDLRASEAYRHIAAYGMGAFDATSQFDGRRRVYVATQIPGAPMALVIATSLATAYAPSRPVIEVQAVALAALTLFIAVFVVTSRRELRLRRASEGAAEAAAAAVGRNETVLRSYFDHLAHGVVGVTVGPGGSLGVERINENARDLLGVSDDAIGRDPSDVIAPERQAEFVAELRRCLVSGRPVQRDLSDSGGDRTRWLRLTVTPVRYEADGAIGLLMASVEDVTLQQSAQARLLQSHGMDRMTSGVANEFNNVLQAMIGYLDMLAEEVEGGTPAAAHAKSALNAAARGTKLTQGLLSSSKQQLLKPEAIAPHRLVAALSASFEAERDDRVNLVIDLEPGTPAVYADPSHLTASLMNICRNGQEAMLPQGGTLTLSVYARDGAAPNAVIPAVRYVVFCVTDRGHGMTPDVMARAREPFFTTKGERFRSGLGLSMADGFAHQSRGELRLESSPAHGTAVELWLPAAEAVSVPTDRLIEVLLVDDAAEQLDIFKEILRDAGCNVTAVLHARSALGLLRSSARFDILVTDYVMPGVNGIDLITSALKERPGLAALLITGIADIPQLASLPAKVGVMRKPFRSDQLLRQILQMASATDQPALL